MLELLPNPALKRVTIDFEKAIWIVLRELLPNVEIQGCVISLQQNHQSDLIKVSVEHNNLHYNVYP